MKLPQWLTKWFTKTNYPKQILNDKILQILDAIDSALTAGSATMPAESIMVIKPYKIGLINQLSSVSKVATTITSAVPSGYVYIPRSIAFVTEADGTWCFRIAFRESGTMDIDKVEMFCELLARTNDARTK